MGTGARSARQAGRVAADPAPSGSRQEATADQGHVPCGLHAPTLHTPPAQQSEPETPHATQVPAAGSHACPLLHHLPAVLSPGQHGSPVPPQPTHTFARHAVNGAVQATPPAQHACPGPPQLPPPHEPPLHVPWPAPQLPAFATHNSVV